MKIKLSHDFGHIALIDEEGFWYENPNSYIHEKF